ncbi:hypothetical protein L6164_020677 [Bauhinia variegata]|uniref:Uncharacterized protein n=1 Tax=Bauhinia variegata TaxID=167791 RepID=A0ACB9MXV8_BAUVA|nr:hypothetical protein L6164_020677 [Bauhinia variegata]
MKNVDGLNDFPFTFSREATHEVCENQETRLSNGWDFSRSLCPCFGPNSAISEELHNWEDYYKWRRIPLDSPVALLLHRL